MPHPGQVGLTDNGIIHKTLNHDLFTPEIIRHVAKIETTNCTKIELLELQTPLGNVNYISSDTTLEVSTIISKDTLKILPIKSSKRGQKSPCSKKVLKVNK